ncbi:MAG: hypothetical protein JWO06_2748 [Bacteroidota bacterium]|nr:hypothetical protein [Bacteroidota bacterium]
MKLLKKIMIVILLIPFILISGYWAIALIKLILKDEIS